MAEMNIRRGLIAGTIWGLAGLVSPVCVIAAFTIVRWWLEGTRDFDREYDVAWWTMRAYPGIVVVPMFLFFAGLATYAPRRCFGFAKTLLILLITSLPLSIVLAAAGMAHRRIKGEEHPPMYLSEVLMFLIPVAAISCMLLYYRTKTAEPHHEAHEEHEA